MRVSEKIDFLSTEFGIQATENFANDVQMMCNFSQGIEEKG